MKSAVLVIDVQSILFDPEPQPFESRVVLNKINEVTMSDYLQNLETKEIVEGSKEYKSVTTVWIFTLEEDGWKVSGIEEAGTLMQFIKTLKHLPPVESTVGDTAK